MNTRHLPFSPAVYAIITALFAAAFTVLWLTVGPWEAVRQALVPALILVTWLLIASQLPPGEDLPIKQPVTELLIAALSIALLLVALTGHSSIRTGLLLAGFLLPALTLFALRYDRTAFGITGASRRAWLILLFIIMANIALSLIAGRLLPPSEAASPAGIDLAEQVTGPLSILLMLGRVIIVAAAPEEFLLRVYLQPRLAVYVSPGWAVLVQALIFSALHLPQQIIQLGHALPLALAYTILTPMNGLIGGVLWHKTRSLPLLIVLHIVAYARFGL